MSARRHHLRSAAIATVSAAAAAAALAGVAGLVSTNLEATTGGAGYGCPTSSSGYGYTTGYGYGYTAPTATASATKATATPTASSSASAGTNPITLPSGFPTGIPTGILASLFPSGIPTSLPTGFLASLFPSGFPLAATHNNAAQAVTGAAATSAPVATACPSTSTSTASASSSASKTSSPTVKPTTPGATPTTSASAPVTFPTLPNPFATPTTGALKVTLSNSKTFVTLGTKVTLSGTVTKGGVALANIPVAITEKYSDGKVVPLGTFTTNSSGKFSHIDRPLYIGNITATALGTKSNTVPSRVILTYRKVTTSTSGGLLSLNTSTRPGFITGVNRQERVQLLLTDSHGRQKKVLALVNAGKRATAPAEAQGINPISFKNINLGHGTFYVVVKVLGTPVNTGAPSKPIKVTL